MSVSETEVTARKCHQHYHDGLTLSAPCATLSYHPSSAIPIVMMVWLLPDPPM